MGLMTLTSEAERQKAVTESQKVYNRLSSGQGAFAPSASTGNTFVQAATAQAAADIQAQELMSNTQGTTTESNTTSTAKHYKKQNVQTEPQADAAAAAAVTPPQTHKASAPPTLPLHEPTAQQQNRK